MDLESYFRSLTAECETLKDRVRHLVNDAHWPTDGEWKESVLRSMLRRSAPESVTVGRGFVVNQDRCSTQIDVLIYDNSMPILYRDGDLVFVTPTACRGIVEVKSSTTAREFQRAAVKLAENAQFIRENSGDYHSFVGLFSYDIRGNNGRAILDGLVDAAHGNSARLINHVSLGSSKLVKFWQADPEGDQRRLSYNRWHAYHLERMAPGYFIHNLLLNVSKKLAAQRDRSWFPPQGKEAYVEDTAQFRDAV